MEEPGGLLSMGLHRVGHDWSDLAATVKNSHLNWKKDYFNQTFQRQVTFMFSFIQTNLYWRPRIFIGRTDAEAEAPILWPPDAKSWLFGKDPDLGKDWRQEEKRVTEDEIVEWHHWLSGHEFKQTLWDSEGQGRLACCSPWGRKELNTTEQLNNSNWHLTMYLLNLFLFVVVSAYKNKRTRREN